MKYRDILGEAGLFLRDNNIEEYQNDAWLLFEKAFCMSRGEYLFRQSEEADSSEVLHQKLFEEWIKRRASHEPLQYITGVQNFMGFDFKVTPDVLIPRFDTEILVEKVLEYINTLNESKCSKASEKEAVNISGLSKYIISKDNMKDDSIFNVLDMCTGSGCIAISLALLAGIKGRCVHVTGADISEGALKVAKQNAEMLNCRNVSLLKSDLFHEVPVDKFDIIVSNPPYIQSRVIDTLKEEVKEHEPRLALDGSEDGLYFYRRITEDAYDRLKHGGKIFFEIGYDQAEQVSRLLIQNGFNDIEIIKDLAGLDRVAAAGKD